MMGSGVGRESQVVDAPLPRVPRGSASRGESLHLLQQARRWNRVRHEIQLVIDEVTVEEIVIDVRLAAPDAVQFSDIRKLRLCRPGLNVRRQCADQPRVLLLVDGRLRGIDALLVRIIIDPRAKDDLNAASGHLARFTHHLHLHLPQTYQAGTIFGRVLR